MEQAKGDLTAVFADNLGRIMKDLEMTYRDLSKASGMSLKSVYNLTVGSNSPSLTTIEKIAKAMRVSVHGLITPDASLDLMMSRRPERAQKALNKMKAEDQRNAIEFLENMADNKK